MRSGRPSLFPLGGRPPPDTWARGVAREIRAIRRESLRISGAGRIAGYDGIESARLPRLAAGDLLNRNVNRRGDEYGQNSRGL